MCGHRSNRKCNLGVASLGDASCGLLGILDKGSYPCGTNPYAPDDTSRLGPGSLCSLEKVVRYFLNRVPVGFDRSLWATQFLTPRRGVQDQSTPRATYIYPNKHCNNVISIKRYLFMPAVSPDTICLVARRNRMTSGIVAKVNPAKSVAQSV